MAGYKGGILNPYPNPYIPRMPVPNFNQPMMTPEQYQAELLKQLQPNLDIYNQQYAQYQQQQNAINNSGQYFKVTCYDDVKKVQAPSDGRPVIIIDDTNGFLYSKKFENGQEYIKGFRLVPNEANNESAAANNVDEKTVIDTILARLDKLEGKEDGDSTNPIE